MSVHPPDDVPRARARDPDAVVGLLQTEIERAGRALAPYCAGISLRVEWTCPDSIAAGVARRGCDGWGLSLPVAASGECGALTGGLPTEVGCEECVRQCQSGCLDQVPEHCCACVQGCWRSWLPLVVEDQRWGVLSLCSECVQPGIGSDRVARGLRARRQWFLDIVRLASALVAGSVARVERTLLERGRSRPDGPIQVAPGGVCEAGDASRVKATTPPASGRTGWPAPDLAARMVAMIRADSSCSMTLKELANQFSRNPAYLSDLFAREVGVPFKRFLTDVRLDRARRLLLDRARSITEIALNVGYASEERFRAAFKQATGCSPSGWRTQRTAHPSRRDTKGEGADQGLTAVVANVRRHGLGEAGNGRERTSATTGGWRG